MKKSLLILLVSAILFNHHASSQILDKLKVKAKQRSDQKIDQTIDKGLDEIEGKNKTKTETSIRLVIESPGGTAFGRS